jgi:hypothetical protein
MVVNLRETQILVRPLAQLFHGAFHRQTAALHCLQKFPYVLFIHDVSSSNPARWQRALADGAAAPAEYCCETDSC